jgi:hypothetical protein
MDAFRRRFQATELMIGLGLPPQPHRTAHQPALFRQSIVLDHPIDALAARLRLSGIVRHCIISLDATAAKRCSVLHSASSAVWLDSRQTMTTTGRWRRALADAAALLGVVWMVPVGILLVGAPIALAIALLLWLGRQVGAL